MSQLKKKPLFNPLGDTDVLDRRMIGGNTTNLNDFNNMKYEWVSDWYRQAMNNFWIPEEINLGVDIKDYRKLPAAERRAYDKILSFLIFLDSLQSANLPAVGEYITANEVNLCLASRRSRRRCTARAIATCWTPSASRRSATTCCTSGRRTSTCWRATSSSATCTTSSRTTRARGAGARAVANYILEGVYFYSGFMFFYNWGATTSCRGRAGDPLYQPR